jgi:hypothetical protein
MNLIAVEEVLPKKSLSRLEVVSQYYFSSVYTILSHLLSPSISIKEQHNLRIITNSRPHSYYPYTALQSQQSEVSPVEQTGCVSIQELESRSSAYHTTLCKVTRLPGAHCSKLFFILFSNIRRSFVPNNWVEPRSAHKAIIHTCTHP